MKHINSLVDNITEITEDFLERSTGRYYTHRFIAKHMLAKLIDLVDIKHKNKNTLSIIDPFAGDGRLILWLLSIWHDRGLPQVRWELFLLDLDQAALLTAKKGLEKLRRSGISLTYRTKCTDSFEYFRRSESSFDFVVTNPPWEQLKPDRRE